MNKSSTYKTPDDFIIKIINNNETKILSNVNYITIDQKGKLLGINFNYPAYVNDELIVFPEDNFMNGSNLEVDFMKEIEGKLGGYKVYNLKHNNSVFSIEDMAPNYTFVYDFDKFSCGFVSNLNNKEI